MFPAQENSRKDWRLGQASNLWTQAATGSHVSSWHTSQLVGMRLISDGPADCVWGREILSGEGLAVQPSRSREGRPLIFDASRRIAYNLGEEMVRLRRTSI
jgi:hypothetical protein